jgi:hypothetical protein
MDTNATNIEPIQWWLHDTSFNRISKIAIGALVLSIKNVSIPKGVVNDNTLIVTFIIFDLEKNVKAIEVQLTNNFTKLVLTKNNN